jgi:hypothetical protein
MQFDEGHPDMAAIPRFVERALPICGGLLAGTICLAMLTPGITVDPDGWAYWEGSVSILNGDGYRFFGGQPIRDFPPLYSLYLSLIQSLSGVSGTSLAVSLVTLAGAAAFLWCRLLVSITPSSPGSTIPRLLGALYIASFVGAYYTTLLSETLFLALLPVVYLCLMRIRSDVPAGRLWLWLGGLSLAAAALVLTRNSAIAFLPGIALAVFLRTGRYTVFQRVALAAVAGGLPAGAWYLTRFLLGQTGSHALALGNRYSPVEYAQQLVEDLAYRFGPSFWHLGALLLAVTAVSIAAALARNASANAGRDALHIMVVAVSAALGLLVLFNMIPIVADTLSGRFIWYLPLSLITVLAILASQAARPAAGHVLALVLAGVCLVQVERTGAHVALRVRNPPVPNVRFEHTISPAHFSLPPVSVGPQILVSPRDFPWINRSYATSKAPRVKS